MAELYKIVKTTDGTTEVVRDVDHLPSVANSSSAQITMSTTNYIVKNQIATNYNLTSGIEGISTNWTSCKEQPRRILVALDDVVAAASVTALSILLLALVIYAATGEVIVHPLICVIGISLSATFFIMTKLK